MNRYWYLSLGAHLLFFCFFTISFYYSAPLAVIENTNSHDIISAVILGDSTKSKIVAPLQNIVQQKTPLPPTPQEVKQKIAPLKNDEIALKTPPLIPKKKVAQDTNKTLQKLFGKNLLTDIQTTKEKQKRKQQKKLQAKFEKALQQQAELSMRQELLADEIKLTSEQVRKAQGIVNKYKALILQAISTNWIVPLHVNRKLSLSVMIRLAPGGLVLDVQVTKGSGDQALDSSVRAAIIKASPLPVPSKPNEFEVFRQFILKVKPENILSKEALNSTA